MRNNWSHEMSLLCVVVLGGFLLILFATGCARRVPERIGGPSDAPHVGWVIMSGDRDNPDRDFVCQSNPRGECVAPVDRPDARVLTHVHFYYHPAATETKYSGSTRIGFFGSPLDVNPNITVKQGDSPGNQSVTGFVSSKPGTYTMTIAVVATSVPSGAVIQIREQVPVTLR
jgi:hypothetical protein